MSEERKTTQVGTAEKGPAPDDAEITKLAKPEEDEVSGRCEHVRMASVMCPHCYCICRIIEDPKCRKWFQCWNCLNTFQY